jgi:hypothetical protein
VRGDLVSHFPIVFERPSVLVPDNREETFDENVNWGFDHIDVSALVRVFPE